MKEKMIIVFICMIGLLAVSYGMSRDNNAVFIVGLLIVIGGDLLIRRKLHKSIKDKS